MSSGTSGLASSIRGATESETFDLAGQNQTTITNVMKDAFATPLPTPEMIRLTFITGAGKLGRQKYDENAARCVTSTLRGLGYEEDRAASCVIECAGTFKSQHDTGKNLKTIVVFPHITPPNQSAEDISSSMGNLALDAPSKIPDGTPENMIALSSLAVFTRMLSSKCSSWSQKKGCITAIQLIRTVVQEMESQLGRGQPLSDADQELLDSISIDLLTDKEALVKNQMQAHVENGNITKMERQTLLEQVSERIVKLEQELQTAKKEKKPKKADKLSGMLEKAQTRQTKIEDITPQPPHKLKKEAEIVKLRIEMAPLLKIESGAKGRLLTMKETKTLARKDEIMEEIQDLEYNSLEWFESDEAFEHRLESSRKSSSTLANQKAKKKTTKSSGNMVYKSNLTNWVTPNMMKKQPRKAAPAKKKLSGSGVFAAMMMDSDSDSD